MLCQIKDHVSGLLELAVQRHLEDGTFELFSIIVDWIVSKPLNMFLPLNIVWSFVI